MTSHTMSKNEHKAMELTAQLTDLVIRDIIGDGPTRDHDINEFVADIHRIQNRILAQSAARAYPGLYRRLGRVVVPGYGES